jgi:CCR4-NOT transcription complex subunit 3
MEQFKVCEKDTKTKAYSKEGLAREAKLDPREAEKDEKRLWANECLDKLNDLIDSIEADIEKIANGKGGRSKGKDQVI